MIDLCGKTILLTGASSGDGAATAGVLTASGAAVARIIATKPVAPQPLGRWRRRMRAS